MAHGSRQASVTTIPLTPGAKRGHHVLHSLRSLHVTAELHPAVLRRNGRGRGHRWRRWDAGGGAGGSTGARGGQAGRGQDRKSTRLNSSHGYISYAVFCLKKKKNTCYCCSKVLMFRQTRRLTCCFCTG